MRSQSRLGSTGLVLVLGVTVGLLSGLGIFTFGYAQGGSYMTNDPKACANCHVMQAQMAGWMKGSHRNVAVCNDCHTPPGFVGKYATKALNGFWHSWAFTTGRFPDEIQITGRNHRVTESSCQKCHAELVDGIQSTRDHRAGVSCLSCHARVGHQ
jgi:cytochrome c nitrite reductase small subunit